MFVSGRASFALFKIDDGNAGFTFTKGAETVGFNISAFFQFVVNGSAQFPCAAAMNDGYLI